MKKNGLFPLVIGAMIAFTICVTLSTKSHAAVSLYPPQGWGAVEAHIGQDWEGAWLAWREKSTGACQWVYLGPDGLEDSVIVYGTSYNDSMYEWWKTYTVCGYPIGPIDRNGWGLFMYGYGGNDLLIFGANGAGTARGGDGDDIIYDLGGESWIYGEYGNDKLITLGSGNISRVEGGPGSDCLLDANYSATVFDCGSGTDYVMRPTYPSNHVNCEKLNHDCPY